MKGAMKSRDALLLNTIRSLISEIKNQEIDKKKELDDETIVSIVASQIKKRKESIALFDKGNRGDLSAKEQQEIEILEKYLPEQVSTDELRKRVREVVDELAAKSPGDLGKVMKKLIPEFQGRADNKLIKDLVSESLGT